MPWRGARRSGNGASITRSEQAEQPVEALDEVLHPAYMSHAHSLFATACSLLQAVADRLPTKATATGLML